MTGLLSLWKSLKTFGAYTIATLKHLIVLISVLLIVPFGLVKFIVNLVRKDLIKFRITDRITQFAKRPDFWRLNYVKEIWPTFLVNRSAPALIDDFRKWKVRFMSARVGGKVVRLFLVVFWLAFVEFKFVAHFFLEALFHFFHLTLVTIAVFLKGVYLAMKLVFSLPSRLILRGFNWSYGKIEAAYPKILLRSLDNRGAVLGGVGALFVFSLFVVGPKLGSELIPEVHQGEFNLDVTLPVGTPVERTDERIAEIQEFIRNIPGVKKVASVSGTDKTANTSSEEGEHTSKITVTLNRPGDRILVDSQVEPSKKSLADKQFASIASNASSSSAEREDPLLQEKPAAVTYRQAVVVDEEKTVRDIRDQMQNYSGVQWKISRPVLFSFKTPIEVEVHGYNLLKLQQVSRQLEEKMQDIPGVIDIKSNVQRGNPEVQIVYNRQVLSQYGLNIRDVASIVRNKVRGDVATEFKERDRKIDILVRLRETDRGS
ncbi:efflux RND transporter permease subunit, partial [bacterium]|nr:efflux RND transporter permease subunit [bacterium]